MSEQPRAGKSLAALCICTAALGASAQHLPVAVGHGLERPAIGFALRVDLGSSLPGPLGESPAWLSLDGAPASPSQGSVWRASDSELHGARVAGLGIEWALRRGQGPDVDVGIDFTRRSGYALDFDAAFAEQKLTMPNTMLVAASASASGRTAINSVALLASLRVDAPIDNDALSFSWASFGLGLGHIGVQAFTAQLDARLRIQGPGFAIDDRFSSGQLLIRKHAFNGFAWQASAGLGWHLGSGRALRMGLRYANLGTYRLICETSEWRVEAQGEVLRAVFATSRSRFTVHELLVSFAQRF